MFPVYRIQIDVPNKVRIPFLHEIEHIHKVRQKIDNGEDVKIEEANTIMRNTKNFLNIFE